MSFLNDLFGGSGSTIITGLLALGLVLLFIVLLVWFLKFFSSLTNNIARGRNKRLAVIDTTHIDQKRQLILIRRDNVEHLLMVGGERDLLIETNIKNLQYNTPKQEVKTTPNQQKKPSSKGALTAPIIAVGSKSLRHTGLMRQSNEPNFGNNPQTSAGIYKKSEPDMNDSDKDSAIDDFENSDIKDKSADKSNKRRKADKE
ncbi:MAG: flagellar biosynthetic protein FliO [Devosiaceae bacterium]|nr:flagellar biosynthetic protein FliO [Devosiaceae bacterium]